MVGVGSWLNCKEAARSAQEAKSDSELAVGECLDWEETDCILN